MPNTRKSYHMERLTTLTLLVLLAAPVVEPQDWPLWQDLIFGLTLGLIANFLGRTYGRIRDMARERGL